MSVMIFTPTIGEQMHPETRASIEAQQTDIEHVWEIGLHNPFPGDKARNVLAQYKRARELFLASKHDALLTIEDDMLVPPDALQKLYHSDGLVVYGVYLLRHGTLTLSAWRYGDHHKMGPTLSLYPREVAEYRARGWGRVSGVGWGCTLIRRSVLERVTIHAHDGGDAGDVGLASDCLQRGFLQIARFDVLCGHVHEGTVLWPFRDGGTLARAYALKNAPTGFMDIEKPMVRGSYYSMPVERAQALRRAGYVRIMEQGGRIAAVS